MKLVRSSMLAVMAVATLSSAAFAKTVTIGMDKMKFVPATVTVSVGDTVVWVNNDTTKQPHNVMDKAKKKAFSSKPVMMVGEKFTWKADQKGTHNYTCTLHPGMDGVLIVK